MKLWEWHADTSKVKFKFQLPTWRSVQNTRPISPILSFMTLTQYLQSQFTIHDTSSQIITEITESTVSMLRESVIHIFALWGVGPLISIDHPTFIYQIFLQ